MSIPLIFRESLIAFTSLTGSYTPFNGINIDLIAVISQLITFAVIAACASAFFSRETNWYASAGPVTMVTQYLGTFCLGVGMWITFDQDPSIQARLAIPMFPLFLLILFASVQRNRAQLVLLFSSFAVTTIFALNVLL